MNALSIENKDSILDDVEKVRDPITKPAYQRFEGWGREAGLVWTPPIEVIEVEASDREITVKISTPGIEAENLHIDVAPKRLVVAAKSEDEAGGRSVKNMKLFRSLSFEREIDPDSAKAELKDGLLTLTVKVGDAKHRTAKKTVVAHGGGRREDRRGRRRRHGVDGIIAIGRRESGIQYGGSCNE